MGSETISRAQPRYGQMSPKICLRVHSTLNDSLRQIGMKFYLEDRQNPLTNVEQDWKKGDYFLRTIIKM